MYISEEAAVVTYACGFLAIGYILLRYVKAQIYKEEKEKMNKKEMSEVVEELDELRRNYEESIRKRNALTDRLESLKVVVDERDDLRAQAYNFKTERDSVIEKLVGQKRMLEHLLKGRSSELKKVTDEKQASMEAAQERHMRHLERIRILIIERDQEKKTCQIELEAQKGELEKITIERNALRDRLSICLSRGAYCTSSNNETTGVNVETITFTPPEEE